MRNYNYFKLKSHGSEWRKIMRDFGCSPDRTHSYDTTNSRCSRKSQVRYIYACQCRKHNLSKTRHNRLQSGKASYSCRHCGQTLHRCEQGLISNKF